MRRCQLQEYFELIKNEESLLAVEKNSSGSRPKEMFEDMIEEAEEEHEKTSAVLKDALKENNINISHTSTFEGFQAALQIASNDKLTDIREPNRSAFSQNLLRRQSPASDCASTVQLVHCAFDGASWTLLRDLLCIFCSRSPHHASL